MRDDVPKVSLAYPPSAKARFMNRKNGLHKRLSRCVLEYRCDLDFVCKLTCRRAGHTANLDGLGARWQFCSLSTEGMSPTVESANAEYRKIGGVERNRLGRAVASPAITERLRVLMTCIRPSGTTGCMDDHIGSGPCQGLPVFESALSEVTVADLRRRCPAGRH